MSNHAKTGVGRKLKCVAACALALWLVMCSSGVGAAEEPADPKSLVSNVWVDVPLRQVLRDMSMQTGVPVAVDPSVADTLISFQADQVPLQQALERAVAGQGLSVRRLEGSDEFYVVGSGRPDSPSFHELARSRRVYLRYITAKHLRDSLPRHLQPYVGSGERSTEVLVYAPEDRTEQVMEIIEQLDRPRRQVVLEALVVELSREAGAELGVDWQRSGPDTLFSLVEGTESFVGTARYASVDERAFRTLLFTIRSLIKEGRASVRSRPRVATLNGEPAVIDISLEQYFNITTDVNGAFLRTELQVVKSGVMLEMTPHVGEDGDITVRVETEVSDVARQASNVRTGDGMSAGDLPIIRRRHTTTNVRVKDGDAIVIGGLIEQQEREEERRVPVLGSIPLLGALFRSRSRTTEEREVVIFITPRLMEEGAAPLAERHSAVGVDQELAELRAGDSPHGAEGAGGSSRRNDVSRRTAPVE
ncbi:MAG: hypothetical protein R6V05_13415 [Candidatus Brocadiia bacterium]